jgi:hypothetical protein
MASQLFDDCDIIPFNFKLHLKQWRYRFERLEYIQDWQYKKELYKTMQYEHRDYRFKNVR